MRKVYIACWKYLPTQIEGTNYRFDCKLKAAAQIAEWEAAHFPGEYEFKILTKEFPL